MASAEEKRDSVNGVARAISDKEPLLESTHRAVVGPNHIKLPLQRDSKKPAFTLEHVLSPAECEALIHAAEAVGFGVAGLGSTGDQVVATEFRNSGRLIVDDKFLAGQIFERIRPYLPAVWEGRRILGLNEQLKFLRYHPGQKFVAHYDGSFCRPNTPNRTCFTVQLYLSQGAVAGGSTRFMGANCEPEVSCSPDPGRALVFQHNILHDGEEVRDGVKYTIRTDVEYSGVTWHAQLQELFGFGCAPLERRRRFLLVLSMLVFACSYVCSRFR